MKENVIEINSANYDAAYAMADEQTRKVLAVLCGRSDETTAPAKPAPTLSDYTTIRSYEDACVALAIEPTLNKSLIVRNGDSVEDLFELPKHIVAQMKLETICRALWGGEVKVYPDPKGERTACALTLRKRQNTLANNSWSCGLRQSLSISPWANISRNKTATSTPNKKRYATRCNVSQ